MKVELFNFNLPEDLIAQRPMVPRDSSRLLYDRSQGDLAEQPVSQLASLLAPGDICVFNDTRVIPARLKGKRGEAGIEITLHKNATTDVGPDIWHAFARPAKKLKIGDKIIFSNALDAEVIKKLDGGETVLRFNIGGSDFMAALEQTAAMPLPPYIKRENLADEKDNSDYQTMFADNPGAVAAPTAGLHFTPELMASLKERGVGHVRLTLHVGAGTFLPVKADDTNDHKMHSEWGEISEQAANKINMAKANGGRVVAIGTTSLRLLESAATPDGTLKPYSGETDIFITPGYNFKIVDMLMTNFHLPKSTLFMLVSAFAGFEYMQALYAHAIKNKFRFYSYGDACLLEISK